MASQILNGSGNISYTNNTGQNVRVIINYMATSIPFSGGISVSWGNSGSANANTAIAFGKNAAYITGMTAKLNDSPFSGGEIVRYNVINANNMIPFESGPSQHTTQALPSEIVLAPGETFSATCGSYNVVIIPEAG